MGTLFKKKGSKQWHMGVSVGRRQICRSAHTTNKSVAKRLLARWETEVFERRFHLAQSTPPFFEDWANDFLSKVGHPNTRKRYTSSVGKLKGKFGAERPTAPPFEGKLLQFYYSRLFSTESTLARAIFPQGVNY